MKVLKSGDHHILSQTSRINMPMLKSMKTGLVTRGLKHSNSQGSLSSRFQPKTRRMESLQNVQDKAEIYKVEEWIHKQKYRQHKISEFQNARPNSRSFSNRNVPSINLKQRVLNIEPSINMEMMNNIMYTEDDKQTAQKHAKNTLSPKRLHRRFHSMEIGGYAERKKEVEGVQSYNSNVGIIKKIVTDKARKIENFKVGQTRDLLKSTITSFSALKKMFVNYDQGLVREIEKFVELTLSGGPSGNYRLQDPELTTYDKNIPSKFKQLQELLLKYDDLENEISKLSVEIDNDHIIRIEYKKEEVKIKQQYANYKTRSETDGFRFFGSQTSRIILKNMEDKTDPSIPTRLADFKLINPLHTLKARLITLEERMAELDSRMSHREIKISALRSKRKKCRDFLRFALRFLLKNSQLAMDTGFGVVGCIRTMLKLEMNPRDEDFPIEFTRPEIDYYKKTAQLDIDWENSKKAKFEEQELEGKKYKLLKFKSKVIFKISE